MADSLVIKIVLPGGHDVRRIRVENPAGFAFGALRHRVATLLADTRADDSAPRPAGERVSVSYDDDEDERVTIRTDQDFAEAVRVATDGNRKSLRLYVAELSPATASGSSSGSTSTSRSSRSTSSNRANVAAAAATGKTAKSASATTLYKPVSVPPASRQKAVAPVSTLAGTAKKNNTNMPPTPPQGKSPGTNTSVAATVAAVQADRRGPPPKYTPSSSAASASGASAAASAPDSKSKPPGDSSESKCTDGRNESKRTDGGSDMRARIEARKSAAKAKACKPATTLSGGGRLLNHASIAAGPEAVAASSSTALPKPSKPVPLKTTSGGAKLFLDGSVEFGFGGEAEIRPDGTVSCLLTRTGFPSVAAQGLSLISGKYYYELTLQTAGCIQVGWASPAFSGRADCGEGVGDDTHSWAYDGYRQRRWHGGRNESWGPKWRAGQTVCCALDCDLGVARFVLDGKWNQVPYHQTVAFTFGQGASCAVGAAGTPQTVRELGGLCPAVSFSRGQRCRFNFGAPGTPFRHSPPPGGYKGVWQAWGSGDNAPPAEAASAKTRPTFTNSSMTAVASPAAAGSSRSGAAAQASSPPASKGPTAQERLAALLCRDEVRTALSAALAHPSVSATLQRVLVALAAGEIKTGAQLKHACTAQLPQLMPAIVGLITTCPELLAVGTQLLATLVEAGVVPKAGGGRYRQHHHYGGSDRNRANRDCNWRQQPFCEGLRRWSGKLAEAVASSAQAATEVAAAAVEQVSTAAASAAGSATTPAASAPSSTEALIQQAIQESAKTATDRESDLIEQAVRLSLEEAEAAKAIQVATENVDTDVDAGESKASADQDTSDSCIAGGDANNADKNISNNPWEAVPPAATPVFAAPQRATVVAVKRNGSATGSENNSLCAKDAAAHKTRPRARFVKDNVPSGGQRAPLAPGQRFSHSWRLVNNGNEPWPDNITARCVGGDPLLGAEIDVRVPVPGPVLSKQAVDISVDLTAPSASGRYISYWRLHSGETRFGDRIWVDVVVHGEEEEGQEDQAEQKHTQDAAKTVVASVITPPAPAPDFSGQAIAASPGDDDGTTPQRLPTTDAVSGDDSSSDSDTVGADWVAVGNIALAMSQGEEQQQQQDGDSAVPEDDSAATAEAAAPSTVSPPAVEPDAESKDEAKGPAAADADPSNNSSDNPVDRLISMGFDREQAAGALALHGGKVEPAVATLLGTSM